jgi:prevent-host-death family protein
MLAKVSQNAQGGLVHAYNMLEAKNNLSKLVDAVESGAVAEIIIARNGKPAARVVPIKATGAGVRFGTCKGEFEISDDIDACDAQIEALFGGDDSELAAS